VSDRDGVGRTLGIALALCIVCSVVVSTAAVVLKPRQDENRTLDRQRNILAAAGMLTDGADVPALFSQIESRIVDLRTGRFTDEVSSDTFDQRRAARTPDLSKALDRQTDIAGLNRRAHFAAVYLVRGEDDDIERLILPVHGAGLWSTLHGFIALESDLNTIAGFGFYEHAETPGLGGEVDNPRWIRQWPGKRVFRDGEVEIQLLKGSVDPGSPNAAYRVDGLAGATLTSRGVTNLLQFWLGENGFQPFLNNLKTGEA